MTIVTGPAGALEDGATFEVNVNVAHGTVNGVSRDAFNLMLRLQYPEFVLLPANFTLVFSNGTTEVLSKTMKCVQLNG